MKVALIILTVLTVYGFAHFRWVRPYLQSLPSFSELWAEEEAFFSALKEWVLGRRTILIGVWGEFLIWFPDIIQALNIHDLATTLGWGDSKKALANIALTLAMVIFRAKAQEN